MPRFPHISLSLVPVGSYNMLTVTYAYHCKFIFSTIVLYFAPMLATPSVPLHCIHYAFPFVFSSFFFKYFLCSLSCGSTCVFHLRFLSFLLFFSQPLPPDSTVCCMSPLLREQTQHYTVKLGHNPLNGTHTSVLQQGQQEVCAFLCVCAGSVLLCINVFTCFWKQKKGSQNLRPVSGLLPLQLSPSEQKPQISTQLPFLPCFGFRGNIT